MFEIIVAFEAGRCSPTNISIQQQDKLWAKRRSGDVLRTGEVSSHVSGSRKRRKLVYCQHNDTEKIPGEKVTGRYRKLSNLARDMCRGLERGKSPASVARHMTTNNTTGLGGVLFDVEAHADRFKT